MKISEKIYRLRTENDLTQVQFAKIAGVSDKAVSTWERGEKEPRMKPLQKICAYFGIDINQFADAGTDIYSVEKPTPVSEDGPSDPVIAQIMDIVRQLSPETQIRCLEYFESLLALQNAAQAPNSRD